MIQYSALKAPVMAFYSRPFYQFQALHGKGLGFVYLLLLLFICWTSISVRNFVAMDAACHSAACTEYIDQIPDMTWTGGKLSIDKPSPYTISDHNQPLIVFDTSGKMKTIDDAAPAAILLTADSFITKKQTGTEQNVLWKDFLPEYRMGPEIIKNVVTSKLPLIIGGATWALGLFVWTGHILAALIYGAIGLLMDKSKLGYGTSVRLAAFAMTPTIVLSTLKDLTLSTFLVQAWPLISIALTVGFLYFAFTSISEDAPMEPVYPESV